MTNHRKTAFTLIELLVVIAIIAILAAILFPVFAQAKMSAKKAVTTAHMKQLMTALMLYTPDYDDTAMPRYRLGCGPFTSGPDPSDGMSWDVLMYPYTKNYGVLGSSLDTGPRYTSPYGEVRRSFGAAGNFLRGYQGCGGYFRPNAYATPPMTYFPQPSDTFVFAEQRMLNTNGNPSTYFTRADWAARVGQPRFFNSTFENTRNITDADGTYIRKAWCYIANDFMNGAIWGMADGRAIYKKGLGKTSNGYNNGTEFNGYEHRAGTWDVNGENFPEYTAGMSCADWDIVPVPGNKGCSVPGETTSIVQ